MQKVDPLCRGSAAFSAIGLGNLDGELERPWNTRICLMVALRFSCDFTRMETLPAQRRCLYGS